MITIGKPIRQIWVKAQISKFENSFLLWEPFITYGVDCEVPYDFVNLSVNGRDTISGNSLYISGKVPHLR